MSAHLRLQWRRLSALELYQVISVAEEVMQRSGFNGRRWHIPYHLLVNYPGGNRDPRWLEDTQRVRDFVSRVVGRDVHIYSSDYEMKGVASANWIMDTIVVRDEDTDDLTLLHECAHLMRQSNEGEGHDLQFAETVRDLYSRYIHPSAGQKFWDFVTMVNPV